MSEDQIRVVAYFEIKPGQRGEFERMANEACSFVADNEEGTLIYDWYVADDDTTARLYELYDSSEALLAHLAGKVGTEILPPMMEIAPMTRVDLFGRPSEGLKAAAQNFPAVLYGDKIAGVDRIAAKT